MELEHLTTVAARVVWGLRALLPADGPLAVLQLRPCAPAGFCWLELLTPHLVCRLELQADPTPPRPVAIPARLLADFRRAGGDRSDALRIEATPDGQVALFAISEPPGMASRQLRLMAPEPDTLPPVVEHLRPIPGPWHCPEPGRMVPPLLMDPTLLIRALRALETAAGKPVELQLLEGSGPIRLALLPSVDCDEIGGGSLQLAGMAVRSS